MININSKFLTKRLTGLERYAVEMSHALQKMKPEVKFLAPQEKYFANEYDLENISYVGSTGNYIWEQYELPRYLKKIGSPLLINLTNTAPVFYDNQVTVIHDLAFLHNPDWYTRRAAAFFKFIVGRSAAVSKKIITVSEFSKSEIVRFLNIPGSKIEVVYSGIPESILNYYDEKSENNHGDYILTVSSIEPRKNLRNLIEAFRKLNSKNLKLLIAGTGNLEVFSAMNLDNLKHENIFMLGYVPDKMLVNLYKNAKVFVYISFYEGFGFPPAEAIACGCPTIVSNVGSMPEVCGNFAYYCNPFDTDDIKNVMYSVLSKDERIPPEKVREFREKYSWKKSAAEFLSIVRELI